MSALFLKDIKSELRTRYSINSLAMFIIVTISVILFSVGNEKLTPFMAGGMFWVIVFFTAMSGLSRAFVSEEERGTTMTLQLIANPDTILGGKMLYNMVLIFSMNIVTFLLYTAVFDSFIIKNPDIFFLVFSLGNIGMAVSSTIIAAIISKAGSKGTLYPVLSFPILLPLMLMLIDLTKLCMDGTTFADTQIEIFFLLCYDVLMMTASFLLFDFIWKD
ncbi:MAG: heme exporter protein CcmB [Ignavibacteriales bacterium]|nr:heme exporter protein CcmB [Ignavibacteriales bacterium]